MQTDDTGRTLTAAVDDGVPALRRVLDAFEGSSIALLDVGLRRPTLDDVFLSLTGAVADESATASGAAGTTEKEAGR
ncbi:hypothetical protein [Nocardioides zeae]|uniref:hypothetical protein n=1 Tax=Nocardioides zeae TaxID=1457234 RepID=UPI00285DF2C0|nr:hypothetical protein [Nocardioides zeae]MDR6174372.1 hypothetical protein [Nocardioides zeae]